MGRRKIDDEKVRSIQKSNGSYLVGIPIELMRDLGWREKAARRHNKSQGLCFEL